MHHVTLKWSRANSKEGLARRLLDGSESNRETNCIEWKRYIRPNGYGYISVGNVSVSVHRLAYEVWTGPIPEGMLVCHRCDNRRCINPAHLFLGSHSDNSRDAVSKGRFPTHRPPRLSGASHPQAKLTDEEVRQIRRRLHAGESGVVLARQYGVTPTQISRIKRGVSRAA